MIKPPNWWNPELAATVAKATGSNLIGIYDRISAGFVDRTLTQAGNYLNPNVALGPDQALGIYYRGGLTYPQLELALKLNGISLTAESRNENLHYYWRKYVEFNQPWPSPTECLDMFLRGYISPANIDFYLQRSGVTREEWRKYIQELTTPLDIDTIRYYYFLGIFTLQDVYDRARLIGYQSQDDVNKLIYRSSPLDPGGILMLRNRGYFDQPRFELEIGRAGYTNADDKLAWTELLKQIPSPSDLIQFAVKEGWDDSIAAQFGYDKEFPKSFQLWMDRQGFGWQSEYVDDLGNIVPGKTWPEIYWRSHWTTISATQAYEMLHRLRGDKNDPKTWRIPGVTPFDIDDVRAVLKIHDYPEPFRDRLAALSYRVPTRVDVRRMVSEGVINKDEAAEYYQDMGYTLTDAKRLVDFIFAAQNTSLLKAARQGARTAIRDAYRIGIIDVDTAMVQLYRLLALSASQIAAFDLLPPADQLLTAKADKLVQAEIDVIDIELAKSLIKTTIAGIRRAFLHNQITPIVAQTLLFNLGITTTRITQYINMWTTHRWSQGKDVSAAKVVRWVCIGRITPAQGLTRLLNLGFSSVDANLMIADGLTCAAEEANKAAEKATANANKKTKAIDDAIKKAAQAVKAAQAALAKHGSPAQLKKWFNEGILSEAEAISRLTLLGFPAIDSQRLLADPALLTASEAGQLDSGTPISSVPR